MPTEYILAAELAREEQIRSVACPACQSDEGKPCRQTYTTGDSHPMTIAHYARLRAWRQR